MTKWLISAAATLALALAAQPAAAQVQVGVQGSYSDDYDFGVGGRLQFDLGSAIDPEGPLSQLEGAVSLDVYFPDCDPLDCTFFELNGNALYPLSFGQGFSPYVGGGLHFARTSVEVDTGLGVEDVSDTGIGLNLLGGAKFQVGALAAFGEAKLELAGAEHFSLTFGVLLGDTD